MEWQSIVVTALLSSAMTLVVAAVAMRVWIIPELERHFDRKADEAAQKVEQQLRARIAQGFTDLVDPMRALLRDRAGEVARSTADIVGDGVRRVLDRLGPRGGPGSDDRSGGRP